MTDKEFQVSCSALDDWRRVIAAGKIQRWEVLKWGVGLNLGLTTISIAMRTSHWLLIIMVVLIAIGSRYLIFHYNRRIAGARRSRDAIVKLFNDDQTDYERLTGSVAAESDLGRDYDAEELVIFQIILVFSVVPALLWFL